MFRFKRIDADELEAVRIIAYATWPQTYEPILGKEQVDYMLNLLYSREALLKLYEEGNFFYLIYKDLDPIGFASFGAIEKDTWHLHKIYILPQYQSIGAGKALLDFVINKVRSLNARKLTLNVARLNKARFFYEKIGFVIVKEVDDNIGNGFFVQDYIMQLDVNK